MRKKVSDLLSGLLLMILVLTFFVLGGYVLYPLSKFVKWYAKKRKAEIQFYIEQRKIEQEVAGVGEGSIETSA